MPGFVANLVQETCPPPGSGTVQLNGIVNAGFVPWSSQFVNGQRCFYAISDGTVTEIGEGVINTSVTTALIRSTMLWNSLGTGTFINFSNTVRCWNGVPAERVGQLDDTLRLPLSSMPRPKQDWYRMMHAVTPTPPPGTPASGASLQPGFDTAVSQDMGLAPSPYNVFTVAEAGFYVVQFSLRFASTITLAAGGAPVAINLMYTPIGAGGIPGTINYVIASTPQLTATTVFSPSLNDYWMGLLNVGDKISLSYSIAKLWTVGQVTVGGASDSFVSFTKISP